MEKLGEFFELKERGTSAKIEVPAGITTFMTMAYVLVVQPGAIIGFGGAVSFTDINGLVIAKEVITVTCAVTSASITLLMGFYASLPFALAMGMGMNFMFGALLQSNTPSFGAIAAITLISGLIFVVLTIFEVGGLIAKTIPKNMKVTIGSAIGLYIAYLGFKDSGIETFTNEIGMRGFGEPAVSIALLGLVIIAALMVYRVNGAILVEIVVVTVMGIPLDVTTLPDIFAKIPDISSWGSIIFCFDFKGPLSLQTIIYIFTTFCGDFFSTLGTALGIAGKAGVLDEDGSIPGIQKPFLVDAIGTCVRACIGNTTITVSVESTSGVEAGGRTGLTNTVVAILFAVMMLFSPLILMIPDAATGPALIFVRSLMVSGIRNIDSSDFTEAFGPFVMVMFVIFYGSIVAGVAADILAYIIIKTATGKFKGLHPVVCMLAVPLVMYFVFEW